MDRTLRGLHKNDSTAQVGEFRKLFFKNTYGIQNKIINLSLKKHFPHLNSKGHVFDDASTSERPSKNSTKLCDGICRKSQQLLVVFFFSNMPKNFFDLRNKYMFLASVIMERENAALEINSNLKK